MTVMGRNQPARPCSPRTVYYTAILMRRSLWFSVAVASAALAGVASAQLGDSSFDQLDHPAIQYSTRVARDPVGALAQRIARGDVQLSFDTGTGYLRSLLRALDIPIESQVAVFSKTSTQSNLIHPGNPRGVYFNDQVSVGWMRGTFVLEIAAQDPEQGTIFYEVDQQPAEKPALRRTRACLRCHHSIYTDGVPGRLVRSTLTAADGVALPWSKNTASDHRTPFDQRWGGWYVTGTTSGFPHMGNVLAGSAATGAAERSPDLETLEGKFETRAYLSPYSDVVALMVLEHQAHLINLLTRLDWETRARDYDAQAGRSTYDQPLHPRALFSFDAAVTEVVDYLLFVDEAPLPGRIQGTSGFAEQFAQRGPFDNQGRSLRQLDLNRRLMRYPCSYLIYSPVFDALPAQPREAIYQRMWQILSGHERSERYARLSESDRVAIVQILRETKKGLPDYFRR
jgi:hypothetical protein